MQNCTSQIKLKETWTSVKPFNIHKVWFFNGPMLTATEHSPAKCLLAAWSHVIGRKERMFQIPFLHKKVCEESVSNAPEVGLSIPFNTMASNHYEQPDVDFSSFSLIKKNWKEKNPSRSIISVRWNPFILMTWRIHEIPGKNTNKQKNVID